MWEVIKDRILFSIPAAALAGLILMIISVSQWASFLKRPIDLYSVDYSNLRFHDHVTADMDFVFSTGLSGGENKAKVNYYLIPMLEEDGEGGAYMSKVIFYVELSKNSSRIDNIAENTAKVWNGEEGALKLGLYSKPVDGFLRKMTKREKKYLPFYMKSIGFTDAEISEAMCPYILTDAKTEGTYTRFYIGLASFLICGSLCAGWVIWKKKQMNDAEALNVYSGVVGSDEEINDPFLP